MATTIDTSLTQDVVPTGAAVQTPNFTQATADRRERTVAELRDALVTILGDVRGAKEVIVAAAETSGDSMREFICDLRDEVRHSTDLRYLRRGSRKKSTRELVVNRLRYTDAPSDSATDQLRDPESKDLLGRGQFGDVYDIAEYPELGAVAKVNRPKIGVDRDMATQRFRRDEAVTRRLAEKKCTRVPAYLAGGELPTGEHFFLMEYVEGDDLQSVLTKKGKLPLMEAASQFIELTRALQEMHTKAGVVHRDVKPGNLRGGTVLDFGMAGAMMKDDELADDATINIDLTDHGARLGTIRYMSADQFFNSWDKKPRNDYYSLALCFMETVSGKSPRRDFRDWDTCIKWFKKLQDGKVQEDFTLLQGLPPEAEDAVVSLMRGEADKAIAILERLAQGGGNSLTAAGRQVYRRYPRVINGAAAAMLVGLMVATGYGVKELMRDDTVINNNNNNNNLDREKQQQAMNIAFPTNEFKSEDIELAFGDNSKPPLRIRSGFDVRQPGTSRLLMTVGIVNKHDLYEFEGRKFDKEKKNTRMLVVRSVGIDPKTQQPVTHIDFSDSRQFIVLHDGTVQAFLGSVHVEESPLMKQIGRERTSPVSLMDADPLYKTIINQMDTDKFHGDMFDKAVFKGSVYEKDKQDDMTGKMYQRIMGIRRGFKQARAPSQLLPNDILDGSRAAAMDVVAHPGENVEFTLQNQLRLQKTVSKGRHPVS